MTPEDEFRRPVPVVTSRVGLLLWEARLGQWTAHGITPGMARLILRLRTGRA